MLDNDESSDTISKKGYQFNSIHNSQIRFQNHVIPDQASSTLQGSRLVKPLIAPIPYHKAGHTKSSRKIEESSLKEFGLSKKEVKE